jgi:4-hydroxy-2-oxoheptanedioate aldolase
MKKDGVALKTRLKRGEIVVGPWCIIPSPTITDIVGRTGLDFVIIDLEHGAHAYEEIENMVRAAENNSCSPLIRVAKNDEDHILHALDLGAEGVIIPHIQSRADAEAAISAAKYYPLGSRGFSPYTRAGGYSRDNIEKHSQIQNEKTVICLILEGKEGIKNLDEILSIKNIDKTVDLIYIGAYDLSQALGIPGQVNHPRVRKSLEQSINKIRRRGIATGGYVAKNASDMTWMCTIGMQFITLLPDVTIIYHAFESSYLDFGNVLKTMKRKEKNESSWNDPGTP